MCGRRLRSETSRCTLYLAGTTPVSNPFNPAVDYPANSVVWNPRNGSAAIRTIFPADTSSNSMTWLILTTSQGGLYVPSSSLQGWNILYIPA